MQRMIAPEIPEDESERQAALDELRLLDTAPEADIDKLIAAVGQVMDAPIVLLTLVDRQRQWFKARVGLDANETPREVSFCGHVVAAGRPLVVEDARQDPRFHDNPFVVGAPHVRYYAAVPVMHRGKAIGTLCVIDDRRREAGPRDLDVLTTLAECLSSHLLLRSRLLTLESSTDDQTRAMAMAIHDLKNPLTSLLAGTQLLRVGPGDAELIEDLAESARQTHAIVLDLLDVLVAPGTLGVTPSEFDAADVLATVERITRRAAEISDRRVAVKVDPGTPRIRADRALVTRSLTNLVSNAIRFAPVSTTVWIEASAGPEPGRVQLAVVDDGPGVDEADRERIFDPFYRSRDPGRGHGLGLAFCARAAALQGGRVALEPDASGSTRFVVTLPAAGPRRP